MPSSPDPEVTRDLQKRVTGLDDALGYIPGHTITTKYNAYKDAGRTARNASKDYTNTATGLRAKRPYEGGNAYGPVGGAMYYAAGHTTLAPLAGTAATTAKFHGDRRDSFNVRYEYVLRAKGEYDGHVKQAGQAHSSAVKYTNYQTKHQKYSTC